MANTKKRKKILEDHKQVGKKYIPPYVYLLGEGKDIEWRQRIIPEYIWLAILNFKFGWADGADLTLSLARINSSSHSQAHIVH
jgi:hypothetical protein